MIKGVFFGNSSGPDFGLKINWTAPGVKKKARHLCCTRKCKGAYDVCIYMMRTSA